MTAISRFFVSEFERYKFTAKEYDEETGLYYYGARYYDAKLSRWCSADDRFDGLYSSQGQDVFAYVHGRPVMMIDPDGHDGHSTRSGLWAFGDWMHHMAGDNQSTWVFDDKKDDVKKDVAKKTVDHDKSKKQIDVSVDITIKGNLVENDKVVGMAGDQTVTYKDGDGNSYSHTIKNARWKEDSKVETYPYEMPAAPEDFYIFASGKQKYPIGTTHSETGIFIHPNGRSEGCILFDLENIIGKKSFYDLRGRVVGENKILRGRINSVVDKRPIADRENYPVYYSDNPKYRKED